MLVRFLRFQWGNEGRNAPYRPHCRWTGPSKTFFRAAFPPYPKFLMSATPPPSSPQDLERPLLKVRWKWVFLKADLPQFYYNKGQNNLGNRSKYLLRATLLLMTIFAWLWPDHHFISSLRLPSNVSPKGVLISNHSAPNSTFLEVGGGTEVASFTDNYHSAARIAGICLFFPVILCICYRSS